MTGLRYTPSYTINSKIFKHLKQDASCNASAKVKNLFTSAITTNNISELSSEMIAERQGFEPWVPF